MKQNMDDKFYFSSRTSAMLVKKSATRMQVMLRASVRLSLCSSAVGQFTVFSEFSQALNVLHAPFLHAYFNTTLARINNFRS